MFNPSFPCLSQLCADASNIIPSHKMGEISVLVRVRRGQSSWIYFRQAFQTLGLTPRAVSSSAGKGRMQSLNQAGITPGVTNRREEGTQEDCRQLNFSSKGFLEAKLSIWKTRKGIIFAGRVKTKLHENTRIFSPRHSWKPCQEWTPWPQQNKPKGWAGTACWCPWHRHHWCAPADWRSVSPTPLTSTHWLYQAALENALPILRSAIRTSPSKVCTSPALHSDTGTGPRQKQRRKGPKQSAPE